MSAVSPAILRAIGYVPAPLGHVEVPDYIRTAVCDVWDGAKLVRLTFHRELSLSILSGIILQSDPDRLRE